MQIKDLLLQEHSKKQVLVIVDYVGKNQSRFDALFKQLFAGQLLAQRASWPLSYCVAAHPQLIQKHIGSVMELLTTPTHPAVKRNLLHILKDTAIDTKYHGQLIDLCFAFLRSYEEPAAIRVFAMRTLARLCKSYPELSNELLLTVEDLLPHGLPSMRAAGKQVIKELKKKYI